MEALSRQVQNGGKRIDVLEFWANELKAPVSQSLDGAIFGAACAPPFNTSILSSI